MKTGLAFTVALLGLSSLSCGEEEPDNYGTVRIELAPANGDLTVFGGTTTVDATVLYDDCVRDFYLLDRTDEQIDGASGAEVFAAFTEKLCSDYDDIPDCEVEEITQTLREDTMLYNVKVTFKITDPASLAYSELHIGPLPTEDFAGCQPIVELRQNGLVGRDANDTQVWRISSLPGSSKATTNQGAPLRVELVRQNP